MRYNPKARLDTSQVRVRRGGGTGSPGGGLPGLGGGGLGGGGLGGGGLKLGGGVGGLILVLLVVLFQSGVLGGGGSSGNQAAGTGSDQNPSGCQSGADANASERCALVADVNSVQQFWKTELPKESNARYTISDTVLFSRATQTGCGDATTEVGPFYCPVDKTVYLDSTFFADMLQGQLHAKGGPFAEAYVIAHEYGHHVQDLLGTMDKVKTRTGANSDSVRLELQADCYAGIWAAHATTTPDKYGEVLISDLTKDDVQRAVDAATAVGDDRIQKQATGTVNPDQWTHGSSAERVRWFETGMRQQTLKACDTFSASQL